MARNRILNLAAGSRRAECGANSVRRVQSEDSKATSDRNRRESVNVMARDADRLPIVATFAPKVPCGLALCVQCYSP